MLWWISHFPIDRWWRQKYKIPFGSEQHLSSNRLSIALEYIEDKVFEGIDEQIKERQSEDGFTEEEEKVFKTIEDPDSIWKKDLPKREVKFTDEDFDNLDLSKFND